MLNLFESWMEWCKNNNITKVIYKAIPHIYHRLPADDDLYALWRNGAILKTVNLSSTIDLNNIQPYNTPQKRHLKEATALCPWIRETQYAAEFMPILTECLRSRHNATPVHNTEELSLLKERFPDNIRLFLCGTSHDIEAAACIYDTAGTAHCQYLATTESGRKNGTLTYLLNHLITETFASRRYFDFGISNENNGLYLNTGLLHQKSWLGGRGIAYQIFELSLRS
ncbi:MAG: GNAT family N-acetyltransferase [Paramuribaculum sp.]|nr:GNAT family N-acetyltransferase [Paramuribaculum sp.]